MKTIFFEGDDTYYPFSCPFCGAENLFVLYEGTRERREFLEGKTITKVCIGRNTASKGCRSKFRIIIKNPLSLLLYA